LLTGGSGFVGRYVYKSLSKDGHNLLAFSRNNTSNLFLSDFVLGDLNRLDKIKKDIINFNPDVIIHLAWQGIPDYSENNIWMNVLQIEKDVYGKNSEELMLYLKKMGIETRPVWALNHKQKPYKKFQKYNINKANQLYKKSLCLPSSTNLKEEDIQKIIECLKVK